MEEFYKDMSDYFAKNGIKSMDDWGFDELTTFGWGLEDWLRKEFPYLTYGDVFAISDAVEKVIVDRYFRDRNK